jgi:hypothetical protein
MSCYANFPVDVISDIPVRLRTLQGSLLSMETIACYLRRDSCALPDADMTPGAWEYGVLTGSHSSHIWRAIISKSLSRLIATSNLRLIVNHAITTRTA